MFKKVLETIIAVTWALTGLCLIALLFIFFWDKPETVKNQLDFIISYWHIILYFLCGIVYIYIRKERG